MATYPYMVQAAYNILAAVFEQWQREPYRWMRERDIQAEIGGRLTQIFTLQGLGSIKGDYGWTASGFNREQIWSRVSYEPYVSYEYKGEASWCYPDIVIWDDISPNDPSPKYEEGESWPILWACELKYGSGDDGKWDIEKLGLLLDQGKIKFGCVVRIHFIHTPKGIGVEWDNTRHGRHLWICDASVPQTKSDS